MSLLLFRKFLSFHLLDKMLNGLARAIAREGADSVNFSLVVAAATGCVQEMLVRSECDTSGSIYPFNAWLAITDPEHIAAKRGDVTSLASNLESLLCRQLASRSATSTQLYASTLKQTPRALIERALALRTPVSPNRNEDACLIHQLVECDPNRFAPALAGSLFGEKVPECVTKMWMAGTFDNAVLSVVNRRDVLRDMGEEGQKLVNALVHRSCVFLQDYVSP